MKKIVPLFLLLSIFTSCFSDKDDNPQYSDLEVKDFVWKGLNAIYLYKDNIPDLANDRFSTNDEYAQYIDNAGTPEDLFESLMYQRQTIDRFSWITDDYIALEQSLNGISMNNGMVYGLIRECQTCSAVYGYVRYVLPNTSASSQGIQRGNFFDKVNGTPLYYNSSTDNNLGLLNLTTYSISMAFYNDQGTTDTSDDTIDPTGESVTLTKQNLPENPIYTTNIIDVNGENVGYLMYNRFLSGFDGQLNSVFGDFVANNVQHLILDLRYNPGGSVNSAVLLASMIAGHSGDIFSTEQWNSEIQTYLEANNPESLINRFINNNDGTPLNILGLDKVYILTTSSSASASELVINCLRPYIQVVQMGTTTTGKYQASTTIYDSPDLSRDNVNPNHTYAMQPLIYKSLNVNGVTDYFNGLDPDIMVRENLANLGILGNPDETLLAAALSDIETSNRMLPTEPESSKFNLFIDSNDLVPHSKEMYTDKPIPGILIQKLAQ